MKRICKYCGKAYDGDSGSSACPDCVSEQKRTTVRDRVCVTCGAAFQGGPAARYCQSCSAERKREQAARHRRDGTQRPLGSIDKCILCGGEYIVTGGRQKYCPACAAEAIRENDRRQSARWSAENTTPEMRRMVRKAASAGIRCVVCGKLFVPTDASITCSSECGRKRRSSSKTEWERANRDMLNAYQRERRRAKAESMGEEEYKSYREQINAKARENYWKRKEKQ